MQWLKILVICLYILNTSLADNYIINDKRFPADFWFGAATSTYQIEGGWNADGKGENYFDYITHQTPSPIADGSTADIACDSYHLFETDVEMLRNLGVTHYRFSLSWTRILPTGFADKINEPGVEYYKKLIKLLKDNNIIPLVTIYHDDMPLSIYKLGGYWNESFIDWFADYSRVCFEQFGDDVQYWMTINEGLIICSYWAEPGTEYQCGHNVLRAHAAAWHIYDKEFRAKQGGQISMVHTTMGYEPVSNRTEDVEATERKLQFDLGWWGHPMYFGDYPDIMKARVGDRLPAFTEAEKAFLKGTNDYFCLNTYSSALIQDNSSNIVDNPSRDDDIGVIVVPNTDYPDGAWGIKSLTKWIQSHYNNPKIIITENGLGVDTDMDTLEDDDRISVIQNYLSGIRDAIDEGVNIFGYTVWSLMDNFEWYHGYNIKLGIHHVDFNNPDRPRTIKKSGEFYKNVINERCLVENCTE